MAEIYVSEKNVAPPHPFFLFRHNGEDIKAETSVPSDKSQKTSCRDYFLFFSLFSRSFYGFFLLSGFGSAVAEIVWFSLMKLKISVEGFVFFFGAPTTINYKLRQNLIAVINLIVRTFSVLFIFFCLERNFEPLQALSSTSLIDLAI